MSQPVQPGEILAGKYRIERVLGEGGMGVVVAATHVSLDQRVAIKFLLPAALGNAEVVARFAREARAAAKIRGEHVARVIDVGELPGGAPYMVMEYLEGEDLAAQLERRGPLPVDEAVDDLLQASEALAEAHAAGIVHRDIKPANLFAARTPDHSTIIKVLDFGISKSMDKDSASLTRTSAVLGSAFYLSPEQLTAARQVDARADIWALGVVLYQLVTGHVPYDGESMPEVVAKILQNTPTPPERLRPDLPPPLAQAILRCLTSDPTLRFQSVHDLAQAIGPFSPRRASISIDKIARVLGGAGARSQSPLASSYGIDGRMAAQSVAPAAVSSSPNAHGPLATSSSGALGAMAATPAPSRSPHERTNMHWAAGQTGETPPRSSTPLFVAAGAMALLIVGGLVVGGVALYPRLHGDGATRASASGESPSASNVAPSASVAPLAPPSIASIAAEVPDASIAAAPPSASAATSSAAAAHAGPSATHHTTRPPGSGTPAHNAFSDMGMK